MHGFQSAFPNVTGEIVWIIALSGIIGTLAGFSSVPRSRSHASPGPHYLPYRCHRGSRTVCRGYTVLRGRRNARVRQGTLGFGVFAIRSASSSVWCLIARGEHRTYAPDLSGIHLLTKRPLADGIFFLAILVLISKAREIFRATRKSLTSGLNLVNRSTKITGRCAHQRAKPFNRHPSRCWLY